MKIRQVSLNNRKRAFEVKTSSRTLMYPYSKADPRPTRADRVAEAAVDAELGREGFTWSGHNVITRKAEWPDWRPPANMIAREADKGHFIPAHMPGGPNNPLGARALYIGDTQFRIHGTTQPWSIGKAASSGCIRMLNEHVIDLYGQVQVGAKVVVE